MENEPSIDDRLGGTTVDKSQVDWRRVARHVWFGLVALGALALAFWTDWSVEWSGRDLSRYLAADYTAGFLYSPAFALLVSPLRVLPWDVTLAFWRVAELVALALAVRGTTLGWAVFLMTWLWASELVSANVMGFATAAMLAVIRWPSVRSVTLYAVMVALVPKPAFLPVLAYGVVAVPEARRWVLLAALAGMAMLAWPGYLDAMLNGNDGALAPVRLGMPGYLAAAAVTVAGLRWPRLLGLASVLANPYQWPYHWTTLGILAVHEEAPAR